MPESAFYAIIDGDVQGVGYRFFALRHARRLGVKGYVRNLDDGTVEVWAEGDKEKLDEFLEYLKEGPSAAFVREIKLEWVNPQGTFSDFNITF